MIRALLEKISIGSLRFVASLGKNEEFQPHQLTSILVVELSRLGDVMVMLPSLPRLRNEFPHATIRVLADQRYAALLNAFETGIEFIGFERPDTFLGLLNLLSFLRRTPVDLAISMSTPRRNALATLASRSRYKLGYLSYVDSLTPFLLTTEIEAYGFSLPTKASYTGENIYVRPTRILEAIQVETGAEHWHVEFRPDAYRSGMTQLAAEGVIREKPFVLLFPFSGWKYREWGLDKFISVAGRIISDLNHSVILACEDKHLSRIKTALPPLSPIAVIAFSDMVEAALLMRDASLVVGNDSGPLHLAAALGIPTLGMYGPAAPALTAPLNAHGVYLYHKVECSPCDQRACIRPGNPCTGLHGADQVFREVARVLEGQSSKELLASNVQS